MGNKKPDINKKQITETGIVFALIAVLVNLYTTSEVWLFIAVGFLVLSLLMPAVLKPLAWLWFGLAKVLSWVSSRIVLFLVFWLIVVPAGLFRKMAGKDSLRLLQFKKGDESVFEQQDHTFSDKDLKHPF